MPGLCQSSEKMEGYINTYVYIYVLAQRNICRTQMQRKQLRDTSLKKYLTIAEVSHHRQWRTFHF